MPRLTLDETLRSGQHARSAAIAAMGQRLASAGPRTRRRVTQRYNPSADPQDDAVEAVLPPITADAPVLVADRSHAFIRDIAPILPPNPRRRVFTAIGRGAALGVMASAGFALVLVAQSPRWSAARHDAAKTDKTLAAANPPPEQPAPAPAPHADGVARPAAAPVAPPPPAVQAPPPTQPAAMPSKALPAARPMQVQLALAPRRRQEIRKPIHVAARQEAPHQAVLAHYELPRWLTEDRPITMSPSPHNLEAPVVPQAAIVPAEKPHPALPPLPRPRMLYAAAGYPPPPPNRAYYGLPTPYGYYQPQPYPP
jgi:hypothetical protein